MLTKKKRRIAKLLADNWFLVVKTSSSLDAIGEVSANTAKLAHEIGGIELSNLVYQLYDELEETKEGTE